MLAAALLCARVASLSVHVRSTSDLSLTCLPKYLLNGLLCSPGGGARQADVGIISQQRTRRSDGRWRALSLQLGLKVALVRLLIHFLQADDVSVVPQQLVQGQCTPPPGLHVPVVFR